MSDRNTLQTILTPSATRLDTGSEDSGSELARTSSDTARQSGARAAISSSQLPLLTRRYFISPTPLCCWDLSLRFPPTIVYSVVPL